MKRLWRILDSTELKLWHMLLAFAASTALSWVVAAYSDHKHMIETQRLAEATEFFKTSNDFDNLSRIYIEKLVQKNAADGAAKDALLVNIQHQHDVLAAAESYLEAKPQEAAETYRHQLATMSDNLRASTNVPDTAPYWATLNDALVTRAEVTADLRRSAGLPVKKAA